MSEKKILDLHISDADVDNILDDIISQNPQLNAQIEKVANDNNAFLCKILKVYPYEDKAYVHVLNNNQKIYCRLSHEVLSGGMCVDYLPNGEEKLDSDGKRYVEPYNELYGIVLKVRWEDLTNENVFLGYVNIYDHTCLKTSNDTGEISIKSGRSILSVDNDRINIMTPSLFINGLPFTEPELNNYYDKTEMGVMKTAIIGDSDLTTDNKTLIGAVNEINTQFNESRTIELNENNCEGKLIYKFVGDWLFFQLKNGKSNGDVNTHISAYTDFPPSTDESIKYISIPYYDALGTGAISFKNNEVRLTHNQGTRGKMNGSGCIYYPQ